MIVFIDGSNFFRTPKLVRESITKAPLAATPIVAVFDSSLENELGILGYKAIRKRDSFKDIKARIAEMQEKGT